MPAIGRLIDVTPSGLDVVLHRIQHEHTPVLAIVGPGVTLNVDPENRLTEVRGPIGNDTRRAGLSWFTCHERHTEAPRH